LPPGIDRTCAFCDPSAFFRSVHDSPHRRTSPSTFRRDYMPPRGLTFVSPAIVQMGASSFFKGYDTSVLPLSLKCRSSRQPMQHGPLFPALSELFFSSGFPSLFRQSSRKIPLRFSLCVAILLPFLPSTALQASRANHPLRSPLPVSSLASLPTAFTFTKTFVRRMEIYCVEPALPFPATFSDRRSRGWFINRFTMRTPPQHRPAFLGFPKTIFPVVIHPPGATTDGRLTL